jgi:hypothetical protein
VPFTGSHPAAVLPLLGIGLAPSALIVGSMAPDFPYFFPMPVSAAFTHSVLGVLTADVVLALVAYLLWHLLLAPAAYTVAPESVRRRLPHGAAVGLRHRLGTVGAVLLVAVACCVGAATHVVWDSFTHEGRWGAEHVPWLAETHWGLLGETWAQHLSTVLGLGVLAWWLVRWWRRTAPGVDVAPRPEHPRDARARVVGASMIGVAALAGFVHGALAPASDYDIVTGSRVFSAIVDAITFASVAGVVVAVGVLALRRA